MGIPSPENKKVTTLPFHAFDRYELHIQACVDFINGKLSFVDPHLRKIINIYIYIYKCILIVYEYLKKELNDQHKKNKN